MLKVFIFNVLKIFNGLSNTPLFFDCYFKKLICGKQIIVVLYMYIYGVHIHEIK